MIYHVISRGLKVVIICVIFFFKCCIIIPEMWIYSCIFLFIKVSLNHVIHSYWQLNYFSKYWILWFTLRVKSGMLGNNNAKSLVVGCQTPLGWGNMRQMPDTSYSRSHCPTYNTHTLAIRGLLGMHQWFVLVAAYYECINNLYLLLQQQVQIIDAFIVSILIKCYVIFIFNACKW